MLLDGVCYGNSRAIVEGIRNAFSGKGVLVAAVEYLEDKASVCRDLAGKDALLIVNREALAGLGDECCSRAGGSGESIGGRLAVNAVGAHYIGIDGISGVTCRCEHCLEGSVCGTHNADGGSPTCEGVAFLGGIRGGDDLLADLSRNLSILYAVNVEYRIVGHQLESCDCVIDSGCCRINNTLLGIKLAGDIVCKGCCESISGLGSVSCCVVGLGLLCTGCCDCRVVSGVVSAVLAPLGNESQILCRHGGGNRGAPAGKGVALSGSRIGYLESCAEVNIGLCAVNSKLILVTAVVDLKGKAAVCRDCAGKDAVTCNREALAGVGSKSYLCTRGCGNVLCFGSAVLAVKTHDIGLNRVGDFACGELSIEGNILYAHDSDFGIPTCEDIACLGGIFGLSDLLADLRLNGCMNSAVNIEGSGVGHKLESCDCIVDSLGGCVNNALLGVLLAGDIVCKGTCESISGLGGVLLVVVLFALLGLSRCDCRVVSGVVGIVLAPLGNEGQVLCGHGGGNIHIPACEGVALSGCRLGNVKSCAVVNVCLCAVNRKLVLVTAVVDLKNKAAVRKDCAGKDTVVSNREALAGLGGYGNSLAGSSRLILDSSVAVVTVKTHDIGLNLVADGACGELSVKSNILDTHDSDFGVPTCEGVAFLGGSFGGDDLLADLSRNLSILYAVNVEYRIVGHQLESCDCVIDSGCCRINNTLLGIKLAGDILIKCGVKGSSGVGSVLLVVVGLCLLGVGGFDSYIVLVVVCGKLIPLSRKNNIVRGHGGGNFLLPAEERMSGLFGSAGNNSSSVIICIGREVRISICYGVLVTRIVNAEDKRTVSGDSAGKDALRGIEREALCGSCVGGYVGGRTGLAGTLIGAVGS